MNLRALEENLRCSPQEQKLRNSQTILNQVTDNPKPKPVTWKNNVTRYPKIRHMAFNFQNVAVSRKMVKRLTLSFLAICSPACVRSFSTVMNPIIKPVLLNESRKVGSPHDGGKKFRTIMSKHSGTKLPFAVDKFTTKARSASTTSSL